MKPAINHLTLILNIHNNITAQQNPNESKPKRVTNPIDVGKKEDISGDK